MKKERLVNTAVTLPKPLLKQAIERAEKQFGERRTFSRYVRKLITADLETAK
jgi:hypothetical protein